MPELAKWLGVLGGMKNQHDGHVVLWRVFFLNRLVGDVIKSLFYDSLSATGSMCEERGTMTTGGSQHSSQRSPRKFGGFFKNFEDQRGSAQLGSTCS